MTPTLAPYQTIQSQEAYEAAKMVLPGGVNSPVRSFRSVEGSPVFIDRAEGAYLWDLDGNRYIDYVGSWGPMILGHAYPPVVQRVQALAVRGTSYGAPTQYETEMAQLVIDAVPSIEMVRFVSSGTEAVMSAMRLARAATGRSKVVKFTGCYHGHVDDLLVKAGSGAAALGVPDSKGITPEAAQNTLLAPYNDLDAVKAWFEQFPNGIAAILVEPVAGNMGCVPPLLGFLEGLRALATQYGALLIFDEVMTGFRVAYGGAQAYYGVMPDITTLGKIVGGGLPVGAYGASKSLMAHVAPLGPMYQAGTLSGNPLAMGAGIETLKALQAPGRYDSLAQKTGQLVSGLQALAEQYHLPLQTAQVGSMFGFFFAEAPVTNYEAVLQTNKARFNRVFHHLLSQGVYLAPSAFEAGFVSDAHTADDITQTLAAFERAFQAEATI
jgi:glutamate-1-semialdehyde 2,1-aminomutase